MRALTDGAGAVVQTYETDEFGVPTETYGSRAHTFQYTGEQRDGETGLIYLRARMYEPQLGRFLQRDPVAGLTTRPQSLNRFTYARGNPCTYTDPSGLWTCAVIVQGSLSGPAVGGVDFGIVLDDQGGRAIIPLTGVYGGSTSIGVSGSVVIQLTSLSDISGIEGPFVTVGGTVGTLGGVTGDVVINPATGEIVGVQLGPAVGIGPLPGEFHGTRSDTPPLTRLSPAEYNIIKAALRPSGITGALEFCEALLEYLKQTGTPVQPPGYSAFPEK